jgi:hypothetical protein
LPIPRRATCLPTAAALCPKVFASIDSTAYLLPWYIGRDDLLVLLKQTIVINIVPLTLNDKLSGQRLVERLPRLLIH